MKDFLQYAGTALSIFGSVLMSMNIPRSRHAWKAWLIANLMLAAWGVMDHAWGIAAMQTVFIATSINGILRYSKRSTPFWRRAP